MKKNIPMAICYDFDDTLSPGNMQEYGFIKKLGQEPKEFWAKTIKLASEQKADFILAYMKSMMDESKKKGIPFRKEDFHHYGASITLFNGLDVWFDNIKNYAASKNIELKHYIISSGLKEMIEGTKIASKVDGIFASYFMYDDEGNAQWPAVALNYTTKTQYLYRLNKNALDISDDETINRYIPVSERFLPFTNMIYIGDGYTDIPCMKMIRVRGGRSIAVYNPGNDKCNEKISALVRDKRVHFTAAADYSEGGPLNTYVKRVIDKIAADNSLFEMESLK